jgi:hypothetical protein
MKKGILWITGVILLTITLSSYHVHTNNDRSKLPEKADEPTYNTIIKNNIAGDFQLRAKLVSPNDQTQIIEHIITHGEEDGYFKEKFYFVTQGNDTLMQLFPPFDFDTEEYGNTIEAISIISTYFRTKENAGPGTTLSEFAVLFPDCNVFYTIYGYYYIATSSYDMVFVLDPKGASHLPRGKTEIIKMALSDFNPDTKITSVLLE